ncbi:hypothetical protein, partial [Pseudomonas viridiflava]|uniref:hypothetical protein n=1 Tax=Pseudomonas viridiflava TaxID=33069 RepID=UPI0019D06439
TFANGNIGRGLRSLAAVELRTSTSQLNALPIFSQVGFMERLQNVFSLGVPNLASRLGISQCQKCGD